MQNKNNVVEHVLIGCWHSCQQFCSILSTIIVCFQSASEWSPGGLGITYSLILEWIGVTSRKQKEAEEKLKTLAAIECQNQWDTTEDTKTASSILKLWVFFVAFGELEFNLRALCDIVWLRHQRQLKCCMFCIQCVSGVQATIALVSGTLHEFLTILNYRNGKEMSEEGFCQNVKGIFITCIWVIGLKISLSYQMWARLREEETLKQIYVHRVVTFHKCIGDKWRKLIYGLIGFLIQFKQIHLKFHVCSIFNIVLEDESLMSYLFPENSSLMFVIFFRMLCAKTSLRFYSSTRRFVLYPGFVTLVHDFRTKVLG